MRITKENIIKLLKAKIISARQVEDYKRSKEDYERAEYWKKLRWSYEDLLEIFSDNELFEKEMKMYESILEDIEE